MPLKYAPSLQASAIHLYDAATESAHRLKLAFELANAHHDNPKRAGGYDLYIALEQIDYCRQLLDTAIAGVNAERKAVQ